MLARRLFDSISIRLRLALWYALLVSVTLTLFSVIVLAVAQYQLENSVDQTLQSRAQLIAHTLEGELLAASTSLETPTPEPTPTEAPTATANASPSATSATTPGEATPTATTAPTPVPTPDPTQSKKIQQQLLLSSASRDLLGKLDLTFEVLKANGAIAYYAPNIASTGLPLDQTTVRGALNSGICGAYTRSQGSSLLRIYVYPILLPPVNASDQGTSVNFNQMSCAGTTGHPVLGAVLVAKTIDDVNSTLGTLRQLFIVAVIIAVVLTSLGSWLIVGNGLRPIARVTRTANAIAANAHAAGLGRRVGYSGPRDEVGELAETFDQMLAALEQVANAQRRFVADASHELRAPLTTIKGSLELLRRAPDLPMEERRAALEDAYMEAERMATLVNDLLLLARADAAAASVGGAEKVILDDQMRGRRELVELDQLALDIFRHGRRQLEARHKGSQRRLNIVDLEPVATMADPGQLRQVMLILLDNAIKYTPPNGQIQISVKRQGNRGAITIHDSGIGIAPEVLPRIFDRFYRGEQAREHDEHGSGLGLAIAKWIVDAHKGSVQVESKEGKGSTFTVLLPAVKHPGEHSSARHPVIPRPRRPREVVAEALARWTGSASRPHPKSPAAKSSATHTSHRWTTTRERNTDKG